MGPNGHLASASNSQIGQQIMAMVREHASAVGLVGVAGSIVVLDPVREGGETEVAGANDAAGMKGLMIGMVLEADKMQRTKVVREPLNMMNKA